MTFPLPLEVLGRLAPILSLTQGEGMPRDRSSLLWQSVRSERQAGASTQIGFREESWVGTRLQGVNRDTLRRVVELGLPEDRRKPTGPLTPELSGLDRTDQYDLAETFRFLGRRYFRWEGRRLLIRADRMEELHQLARFFPVSQVVRSLHAAVLDEKILPFDDLLQLPVYLHSFDSGNRMLQALVRRGLAEGHMHLWGVSSSEEVWADHLLAPDRPMPEEGPNGRHLRHVSRLLLKALVLALLGESAARASMPRIAGLLGVHGLYKLLDKLDGLLQAPTGEEREHELRSAERSMERRIDKFLRESSSRRLCSRVKDAGVLTRREFSALHFLLAPDVYPLFQQGRTLPSLARPLEGPASELEGRARVLAWLHLVVHRRLLDPLAGRYEADDLRQRRPWGGPGAGIGARTRGDRQGRRFERASPISRLLRAFFFRYLACETYHHQRASQPGDRLGLEQFRLFYDASQRYALSRDRGAEMGSVLRRLLDQERIQVLEGRVTPSARGDRTIRPWLVQYAERRLELSGRRRRRRDGRRRDGTRRGGGRRDRRAGNPRERDFPAARDEDDRFGLVVHFLKRKERPRPESEISRLFNVPRHHEARRRVRREAMELYTLLREPDPVVPFIVGIDAANVEYSSTPPEVFAPAFNFLRSEPIGQRPDSHFRRQLFYADHLLEAGERHHLALTFHSGEDFVAPLSGLRAIDEAIEFLNMVPGDRLGHAIALGVDPTLWARAIGHQTLIPKQEFLDTLVWTRQILGPGHDLIGQLGIDDTIQALSSEIYQQKREISPLTLHEAWLLRQFDPDLLPDPLLEAEVPERPVAGAEGLDVADRWMQRASPELELRRDTNYTEEGERWWRAQQESLEAMQERVEPGRRRSNRPSVRARWLHNRYLYDEDVKRRGDEPLPLDLEPGEPWDQVIRDVQARMQKKVHDRHLIVEVNPSSNVTIGPFETVSDLHLFQLAEEQDEVPVILATVNTDDPGVFQTSLAHEYYLLGEAMLRRGDSESQVLEWLERLRRNGHDYSFLSDLKNLRGDHIDALCEEILELYPPRTHHERVWFERDGLETLFL